MDLSWSVLDAWALEEAEVDFGQSLVMCPEVPQKMQNLLSRWHCLSWGVSFPSFLSFEERSGTLGFFCSEVEPLPWVEPELWFFCLGLEEPLPDLLSDLLESDLCSDLFPEDPEARVLQESSPLRSQYHASIAWTSFRSPARVVSLLWWTISSLIHLASPF